MFPMFLKRISLDTFADVNEFVTIASKVNSNVRLIDGEGFCVNGKSLLGAVAAMEWSTLYCVCDEPIDEIEKFVIEDDQNHEV